MARLKAFDEDRALDLAVDCFWSRGYEGTSVRDLAESMGIGGASLFRGQILRAIAINPRPSRCFHRLGRLRGRF